MSKSTTKVKKPLKRSFVVSWKPHAYQKKAVRFVLENACAGLFLDPGLGKTSIILAALKVLKKERMLRKVLIIAPLRVCYSVWPKEIEKWTDFSNLTYTILHGKDKEKNLVRDVDIYLINPEGLSWLCAKRFKNLGFDVLVIDESSKFKSTTTQRFKLLRPCLTSFRRRYILTGTPAPQGLLDLFGQVYILDLGNALGRFITHYRNAYFYPTGFGGYDWKLQDGAEVRIQERIKPLTLRLAAEDYLELPQLLVNRVEVELDTYARQRYDEMEEHLLTSLERGEIVASTAAVASGKCRQIANGGLYDAEHNVHHIHDIKARAVADLVDELNGTPALIAYEFEHDLQRLRKVLGKDVPHIGGGVSVRRSSELAEQWNKGQLPMLLGHPAAMGHGLNLQGSGNHVIWHSLPWNFEHYDQFNRRVLRQGSRHKQVFVHHIVAVDTIDELILFTLYRKFRTQKQLLDSLKDFLHKRRA